MMRALRKPSSARCASVMGTQPSPSKTRRMRLGVVPVRPTSKSVQGQADGQGVGPWGKRRVTRKATDEGPGGAMGAGLRIEQTERQADNGTHCHLGANPAVSSGGCNTCSVKPAFDLTSPAPGWVRGQSFRILMEMVLACAPSRRCDLAAQDVPSDTGASKW